MLSVTIMPMMLAVGACANVRITFAHVCVWDEDVWVDVAGLDSRKTPPVKRRSSPSSGTTRQYVYSVHYVCKCVS